MSHEVKWTDSKGREVLAIYHPGVGLEVVEVRNQDAEEGQAKPSESKAEAEEER